MTTKISWCDETINPVIGCSKESEGCRNCYAEIMAVRLAAMGTAGYPFVISFGRWSGLSSFVPSMLRKPYSWKRPRSIFIGSMGDMFMESVPFGWIDEIMRMVHENDRHTFVFLTKRPERMREYFTGLATPGTHTETAKRLLDRLNYAQYDHGWHMRYLRGGSLPNLVLGVSVENQQTADERIPELLATPAVKRFISLEPMLGLVDLTKVVLKHSDLPPKPDVSFDALRGWHGGANRPDRTKLDGVILGGESGPKARPLHPLWVRTVRDQCAAAGVPFMFKQWGKNVVSEHGRPWEWNEAGTGFPELDGKTHTELPW